jgi:hypothetical protein
MDPPLVAPLRAYPVDAHTACRTTAWTRRHVGLVPQQQSENALPRRPPGEGVAMPYGRCVIYSFAGDVEEIISKARSGILPIFQKQPGFVAYGVMVRGEQLISMSAWDSEDDAKAADELAKAWVAENVDMTVVNSFIGDYEWLEFAQ